MTVLPHILMACLLAGGTASAAAPKKNPLAVYAHLWSPPIFTTPAKVGVLNEPGLLADWSLAGVAEVPDGYRITLQRQKTGESMTLRSAEQGSFKVERVQFGEDWRETVVHISSAGKLAALRFDPASMAPAPAPAAATSLKTPAPAGSIAPKASAKHPH